MSVPPPQLPGDQGGADASVPPIPPPSAAGSAIMDAPEVQQLVEAVRTACLEVGMAGSEEEKKGRVAQLKTMLLESPNGAWALMSVMLGDFPLDVSAVRVVALL